MRLRPQALRCSRELLQTTQLPSRDFASHDTSGRGFTVGIIGGGQLARMMHAASIGLGVNVRLLAEAPDSSAAQVVHDVTVGDYTDPDDRAQPSPPAAMS